jgi:hypothetical protein
MKKLPIGIQTFRKLIKENYLYVDKTKDIYNLILQGSEYFFISRPRRFGKSLLVSTLKEIFSGNKDLFKGLWIYDKIEWEKYPVITIDFTKINYETPQKLDDSLKRFLDDIAEDLGFVLDERKNYKESFLELIKKLSTKGRVVVLIDEYDKPIIEFVDNQDTAKQNRDILKAFYEVLKAADEYLKFVFITGVSKFSKVSIFSGLNNLNDITLDEHFSTMLGYTHEEFLYYFKERLGNDRIADIKRWYNGYSWDGKNFLYNPLSILLYFDKGKFGNFWFSTGTPSFLIKSIKDHKLDVKRIEDYETNKFFFDSFDIERINVFSLLFQTGYLTVKEIKDVSPTQSIYRLSYPNEEVKESFLQYLAADFTGKYPDELGYLIYKLQESITGADLDHFFEIFKSIFASVPYDIFIDDREAYYHTIVYLVLKLMGINIAVEVETNIGRIDAVFETGDHVFLLEFKIGKAAAALAQIKKNKYYEKYLSLSKKIKILGVGFDMEQRNIGDYRVEDIPLV